VFGLSLCAVTVPAVLAAGTTKIPAAPSYKAVFTGSGTFTSTTKNEVGGVGKCKQAIDAVTETSTFKWSISYAFSNPTSSVGHAVTAKGTYAEIQLSHLGRNHSTWTSTSTVSPAGCMGGNQNCSATLEPAGPANPAFTGDTRKPEFVAIFNGEGLDVNHADSVVDWVVAPPVTGSSDCSSLYSRWHTALQPFSTGARNPMLHVSIESALAGQGVIPLTALHSGKPVTLHRNTSAGPPANCKSMTEASLSCSERLSSWSGSITVAQT